MSKHGTVFIILDNSWTMFCWINHSIVSYTIELLKLIIKLVIPSLEFFIIKFFNIIRY